MCKALHISPAYFPFTCGLRTVVSFQKADAKAGCRTIGAHVCPTHADLEPCASVSWTLPFIESQ